MHSLITSCVTVMRHSSFVISILFPRASVGLASHCGTVNFRDPRALLTKRWLSSGDSSNDFMRSRTWRRLSPFIKLSSPKGGASEGAEVIADVGCDHGLLAWGLCQTGRFDKVYGVDASCQALQQGAMKLVPPNADIEFLVGNGLEPLDSSIDTVCVAGMGVHTMQEILSPHHLNRLACQKVICQPTNSRPRHMMMLYQHLSKQCGFEMNAEHMEYLSKRWYLTTSFTRTSNDYHDHDNPEQMIVLPGETLLKSSVPSQRRYYQEYVDHHIRWLESNQDRKGKPLQNLNDQQWLSAMRRQ